MTVGELIGELESLAPAALAEEWDAIGLQAGSASAEVYACLVTVDVTEAVVSEAVARGAELIIAHHPLIFQPLREVRGDRAATRALWELIGAGLTLFVAHTNLDAAEPVGTACALADALGLRGHVALRPGPMDGAPLAGRLAALDAPLAVQELHARAVGLLGATRSALVDAGRPLRRIAAIPGSAGSLIGAAIAAGAEGIVCGELSYHAAMAARAEGLSVIECGHYATERPVIASLCGFLRERLGGRVMVLPSTVNTDPYLGTPGRAERFCGQEGPDGAGLSTGSS